MTTKEKEAILNLLEVYKGMPFLWNKTHKDYTNRDRRSEGHGVLLEIYKNVEPNATVQTLGKKIQNLRTNYKKERNKVLASEQAGDEAYVPTLWYYEAMSFLGNRTESCHNVTESDPFENVEISLDYDDESISSPSSAKRIKLEPGAVKQDHTRTIHPPPSKPSETVVANSPRNSNDDRWEAYGRTIGYQVKDLSGHQLVICQKLISDAIFYAKLNKLNENSHVVNPDESVVSAEDGAASYMHIHNDAF